jgi:hypothetical protein
MPGQPIPGKRPSGGAIHDESSESSSDSDDDSGKYPLKIITHIIIDSDDDKRKPHPKQRTAPGASGGPSMANMWARK